MAREPTRSSRGLPRKSPTHESSASAVDGDAGDARVEICRSGNRREGQRPLRRIDLDKVVEVPSRDPTTSSGGAG